MAALIGFDFCFVEFSKEYGMFIVDAHDYYPEGKIERVSSYYPMKMGRVYLHFSAPEEISVFLKLKYGSHICERPAPQGDPDFEAALKRFKIRNSQKKYNKYFDIESNSYDNIYYTKKISEEYIRKIIDTKEIYNSFTKLDDFDNK